MRSTPLECLSVELPLITQRIGQSVVRGNNLPTRPQGSYLFCVPDSMGSASMEVVRGGLYIRK
jgi:hypothetical protein